MKKLITCLALSSVLFTGCTFLQKSEGIIKVNDTTLNTFITNTYGTVFPVYKDKETIHYENDAQTLDIFPAGIVTNNKTYAAAWTDKTSYPIYYITYNSDGKIIIEKYISSMLFSHLPKYLSCHHIILQWN